MALTTEESVLLGQYRAAYASLISGTLVAEVTSNGRTVKFGQAAKGDLQSEIARLEALALCGPPTRRRGAVRFTL